MPCVQMEIEQITNEKSLFIALDTTKNTPKCNKYIHSVSLLVEKS